MPRRLRLDSGAAILALVGVVFLLVGSVLATVFCWGLPTDWGIERRKLELTGEVTQAAIAEGRRINRKPATRIEYRYVVDGVAYADDLLTIDRGLVAAVQQPGARVALEVDREAPARSRIAGTTRSVFGWGGALTLVFPLFGLALLAGAGVMALRGRG
jgi:hypothetical protein